MHLGCAPGRTRGPQHKAIFVRLAPGAWLLALLVDFTQGAQHLLRRNRL